jgi:hypothetical protein
VAAAEEAKVLAKLGEAQVSLVDLNTGMYDPDKLKAAGDVFKEVKAAPPTVAAKVNVCRKLPPGTSCELWLASGVPMPDPEAVFGPARGRTKRTDPRGGKQIEYHAYGNLEVGVRDGVVVSVVVKR